MDAKFLGSITDALLTSVGGVFIALYGYGVIGRKPRDILEEEKLRSNKQLSRTGGLVLIAVGAVLVLFRLASGPPR
jgi:hypothetical protein